MAGASLGLVPIDMGLGFLDNLDNNTIRPGLAVLELGRGVSWVGGVDSNTHLATVLGATEQGSLALSVGGPLATIDGISNVGVQNGGLDKGRDVLGEDEDGGTLRQRQGPLLASGGSWHLVEGAHARVALPDEAQVRGQVLELLGVDLLRGTAIDAVADLVLAFNA